MINLHTPFNYNKSVYGGTEYMARTFLELIYPKLKKLNEYICIIAPGNMPPLSALVEDKRKVVAWIHNTPKQFHPDFYKILSNQAFLDKLERIVVPSVAAKEMFIRDIPSVNPEKIYVINNAVIFADYNSDKFKKINQVKVIHTSDPSRGMPILVESMTKVKGNIEVNIFNDFNPDLIPNFNTDLRVKFYNRTPRATVKSAMEQAHIYAYPSIFEETFCLSIVEAMSAGALPIYSNIGSLPEVTNGFGIMYEYSSNPDEHYNRFISKFEEGIDLVKSGKWKPDKQIKYVKDAYSWKSIERQWMNFEERLGE